MKKTARIYALLDEQNDIRYVGSTGLDIQRRAAEHHRHRNADDDRSNPELNAWLRGMERPPHAILLAEVAWEDRMKAETYWTRWARKTHGHLLLNKLDGATPTPETMQRRRAMKAGHYRPHSERGRANIAAGVKKSWERRRGFAAEQARLELELGPLYKVPRTVDELHKQIGIAA